MGGIVDLRCFEGHTWASSEALSLIPIRMGIWSMRLDRRRPYLNVSYTLRKHIRIIEFSWPQLPFLCGLYNLRAVVTSLEDKRTTEKTDVSSIRLFATITISSAVHIRVISALTLCHNWWNITNAMASSVNLQTRIPGSRRWVGNWEARPSLQNTSIDSAGSPQHSI